MHNYATTRGVGQFIAFVGWVAVGISGLLLIAALGSMRSGFGLLALGPAFALAVGGLVLVAQGQLIQAVADTAMNTGQLVELMRGERLFAPPAPAPAAVVRPAPAPAAPPAPPSPDELEAIAAARAKLDPGAQFNRYRGYTIVRHDDGTKVAYRASGSVFNSVDEATDFIDGVEGKAI